MAPSDEVRFGKAVTAGAASGSKGSDCMASSTFLIRIVSSQHQTRRDGLFTFQILPDLCSTERYGPLSL